jgi:hypothetical protein
MACLVNISKNGNVGLELQLTCVDHLHQAKMSCQILFTAHSPPNVFRTDWPSLVVVIDCGAADGGSV